LSAAVLLGLALFAEAAGEPRAKAAASKAEVRVGEAFSVEVTATGPSGTRYTFPKDPGSESVELREPGPSPDGIAAEPAPGTHRYQATAFAVTEAEVPPLAVSYRLPDGTEGVAKTDAIPLRIVSVLPKDPKEQKLADIRGPVPLRVAAAFWIAAGILVLLLAAGAVWLVRRRRRPAAGAPAAPPVAPDVEATRALDRLASSGLLEAGDYRGYYIALAEIAKRYLEARLGAPVLEMTSAETYAFLRDHAHGSSFALPVRDLSGAADRVKFARGAGLEDEARRHLAGVRQLVLGLEQKLEPPTPTEGKAA
jgi:hypothetical protein